MEFGYFINYIHDQLNRAMLYTAQYFRSVKTLDNNKTAALSLGHHVYNHFRRISDVELYACIYTHGH